MLIVWIAPTDLLLVSMKMGCRVYKNSVPFQTLSYTVPSSKRLNLDEFPLIHFPSDLNSIEERLKFKTECFLFVEGAKSQFGVHGSHFTPTLR